MNKQQIFVSLLYLLLSIGKYGYSQTLGDSIYQKTAKLFKKGHYAKAAELASKTIHSGLLQNTNSLNQFRYYSLVGKVLTYKEEFEEADLFFTKADSLAKINPFIKTHEFYVFHLNHKGWLFAQKEQFRQSEKYLLQAKSIESKTQQSLLYTRTLLGALYIKENKFELAEDQLLTAIQGIAEIEALITLPVVILYNQLGLLYYNKGRYETALNYLNKAILFWEKKQWLQHPEYANTLNLLALVKVVKGEVVVAESYLEKAKKINQYHQLTIPYAYNLASFSLIYANYGKWKEAKSLNDSIGLIFHEKKLYLDYCTNLYNRAYILELQDSMELAINFYKQVQNILENRNLTNTLAYAGIHNVLAYFYEGNFIKADSFYNTSLQIAEQVAGSRNIQYLDFLHNYSYFLLESDSLAKAEKQFLKIEIIIKDIFGTYHSDYTDALFNLADFYTRKLDYAKAGDYYKKGIETHIELAKYHYSQFDEETRLHYLQGFRNNLYKYYSFVCQKAPTSERIKTLQSVHLAIKNLGLDFYMDYKSILQQKENSESLSLYNDIQQHKNQLSKAYLLSEKERQREDIDISTLKAKIETLERQLFLQLPLSRQDSVFTSESIRKKLRHNEAAIDFFTFYPYDKTFADSIVYYAIINHPDIQEPILQYIGKESDIKNIINTIASNGLPQYIAYPQQGFELYQKIFQLLEPYLKNIEKIHLSTSRLLSRVSFGALPVKEDYSSTLAEHYEISYYASLRDFLATNPSAKKLRANQRTIALFGGAEFQQRPSDTTQMRDYFQNLPGTLHEVQIIEDALRKESWQTQLFTGKNASEKNFKQLAKNTSPKVIHIATHGYFFNRFNKRKKPNSRRTYYDFPQSLYSLRHSFYRSRYKLE